jgi:hypothetical protein
MLIQKGEEDELESLYKSFYNLILLHR